MSILTVVKSLEDVVGVGVGDGEEVHADSRPNIKCGGSALVRISEARPTPRLMSRSSDPSRSSHSSPANTIRSCQLSLLSKEPKYLTATMDSALPSPVTVTVNSSNGHDIAFGTAK
jgi:hypothetical protein